jgi:signal transduction histidine kinase
MGWRPDHPGSCSVVLAAPFLTLWSSLYPRLDRAAVVVQRLMFLKALMTHSRLPHSVLRSPAIGYAAAVVVPTTLTFISAWLSLPPFIFEHLMVLLVVAVALPWGLTPAVVAALVSVTADNVLLREPIGRPTITGYRDLIDLALYATVAVVVSSLVTRAHTARLAAQDAALLERRAREDRDRLVATVMHDLATPLAVLGGSVRFARARPSSQVDWARLLSRLDTATTRATSLLRLLSDARALDEDRDLGLEIGSHDLRTVVAPIAEMMDRFSERHPVVFSAPEHPVVVTADAERLQQVIENLINNAIKSPRARLRDRHLGRGHSAHLRQVVSRTRRSTARAWTGPRLEHCRAGRRQTSRSDFCDGGGGGRHRLHYPASIGRDACSAEDERPCTPQCYPISPLGFRVSLISWPDGNRLAQTSSRGRAPPW